MRYEINGKTLKLNGKEIEFPEPIEKVVEFDEAYVIMFANEKDFSIHNIVALGADGNELWNIADVVQLEVDEAYVGLGKKDSRHAWVRSLSGVRTIFDVYTKEIIEQVVRK